MKSLMMILGVFVLFFTVVAFGEDAAVVAPTWGDAILKWMESAGGIATSLTLVAEILFRLLPTAKPLSILIPVKYAIDIVAKILVFLSALVDGLVNAANNTKK